MPLGHCLIPAHGLSHSHDEVGLLHVPLTRPHPLLPSPRLPLQVRDPSQGEGDQGCGRWQAAGKELSSFSTGGRGGGRVETHGPPTMVSTAQDEGGEGGG